MPPTETAAKGSTEPDDRSCDGSRPKRLAGAPWGWHEADGIVGGAVRLRPVDDDVKPGDCAGR